jgi:hypothetical protein
VVICAVRGFQDLVCNPARPSPAAKHKSGYAIIHRRAIVGCPSPGHFARTKGQILSNPVQKMIGFFNQGGVHW